MSAFALGSSALLLAPKEQLVVPVVPGLETGKYYKYQELGDYLRIAEEAAPHLVRLFTIGTSYEGRPILLAEITNGAKGQGIEKPAIWVDGGLRGSEFLGSSACLDLVRQLVSDYGRDALITDLLDHCTFYVVPRPAPDAAEQSLVSGEVLPASTRPYPRQEPDINLRSRDINGDGRILQMRIVDESGGWKASRRDPRLLVRRQPDDRAGPFYRLLPEGFLEGAAALVKALPVRSKLAFERNFPCGWQEESERSGSGPYPISEPETRCLVDFFRAHPNICVVLSCGTVGGKILHPNLDNSRIKAATGDQRLFAELSKRLEEITGYKSGPHPQGEGSFIQWCYESQGLVAFQPQLWCLGRAVGLEVIDSSAFVGERSEIDSLSVLRWLDREAPSVGYVPWSAFSHPQLGNVEIGGWDSRYSFLNPPPGNFIQDSADRFVKMTITLASGLPRLRMRRVVEEVLGWSELTPPDAQHGQFRPIRKLSVEVENSGYLSSWLTEQAKARATVGNLEIRIHHDAQTELLLGNRLTVSASLPGCNALWQASDYGEPHQSHSRFEWVVRGSGLVQAEFLQEKSGVAMVSWSGEAMVAPGNIPVAPVVSAPLPGVAPPPPPPPAMRSPAFPPSMAPGYPAATVHQHSSQHSHGHAQPQVHPHAHGHPASHQHLSQQNAGRVPYPSNRVQASGEHRAYSGPDFGNQPVMSNVPVSPADPLLDPRYATMAMPATPTHAIAAQPPGQPQSHQHPHAPSSVPAHPTSHGHGQSHAHGHQQPHSQMQSLGLTHGHASQQLPGQPSSHAPTPSPGYSENLGALPVQSHSASARGPAAPQSGGQGLPLGAPIDSPSRGRVLGQPPAKPGAELADPNRPPGFVASRPNEAAARREPDEFSPGIPLREPKPNDAGGFSPGLPMRPGAGSPPSEPVPARPSGRNAPLGPAESIVSMDFDAPPPEAPAVESRVPAPLFLRKKRTTP